MFSTLREIARRREMLSTLIVRHLKIRYKNSTLGFLWTVLNPIFMAIIYWFFISKVARAPVPIGALLVGVFAWNYTVMSVMDSTGAVIGNANLVKKVAFPREILPLSVSIAGLINFLLSQIVVLLFLLATRTAPSPWVVLFPFIVLAHFCLCLGLSFIVSCANVYFRDTEHLVGVLLSAWFFMSPVMYAIDQVKGLPRPWFFIYCMNPVAGIVSAYRAVLLPGKTLPPDPVPWAVSFALCGAILLAGYAIFRRAQANFGDVL